MNNAHEEGLAYAHDDGWQAAREGTGRDECPYRDEQGEAWRAGWEEYHS